MSEMVHCDHCNSYLSSKAAVNLWGPPKDWWTVDKYDRRFDTMDSEPKRHFCTTKCLVEYYTKKLEIK